MSAPAAAGESARRSRVPALSALLVRLGRLVLRDTPGGAWKEPLFRYLEWRAHRYCVRTRYGFRMAGSAEDMVQGYIYYFGLWEPALSHWLARTFDSEPDRCFVDVGANAGWYSLLVASRLGPGGCVLAIEPSSRVFPLLAANVARNALGNVRLLRQAATVQAGQIRFHHADSTNTGASTTVAHNFETSDVEMVAGAPLAQMLTAGELARVRVIKIDVEGGELDVVRGMLPAMQRLPADLELVIEVTPRVLGDAGVGELFDLLRGYGFRTWRFANTYAMAEYAPGARPAAPEPLEVLPTTQADVLFTRRSTQ
jgi:FkbM family methyltransferase